MCANIKTLILASLVLLNGCTVQEKYWGKVAPVFVSEEAKQHIKSTKVMVSIDQNSKLGIPILGQRTSHQYYGVIGKLAESAEVRFEKGLSEENRSLLRSVDITAFKFDTGAKFSKAVESSLRSLDWLKVSSVVSQTDLQIAEIESMVQTQDEDALLLIDNRYLMAVDFSSITVLSYVSLYAHEKTLVKIAKDARPYEDPPTLYKNFFSFQFRYTDNYTTPHDALKGWSNNEGEMVQRAISESINDLTKQIIADLSFTTSK